MIKKAVCLLTGVMLAGIVFVASSVQVKAALPCTYDIINDANGQIAAATAAYEAAKANEATLLANFNAIKADPAHSQIQYEKAAFDYANACNVSQWCLAQVNNAKDYLKNISDRGAFEDKYAANHAAVADLTTLKASKMDADGAANIANATAQQIADVEKALAGYQQMLASGLQMQSQINDLTAKLNYLKAQYAEQAAAAGAKAATFQNNVNTLNYGAFDLAFENYQHNREWQREDPEHYDVKNQKWIGSDVPYFKTIP